jgi:hypothetical protein
LSRITAGALAWPRACWARVAQQRAPCLEIHAYLHLRVVATVAKRLAERTGHPSLSGCRRLPHRSCLSACVVAQEIRSTAREECDRLRGAFETDKRRVLQALEHLEAQAATDADTDDGAAAKSRALDVVLTATQGPYKGRVWTLHPRVDQQGLKLGRSTGKKFTHGGVSLPDDEEVSTTHGQVCARGPVVVEPAKRGRVCSCVCACELFVVVSAAAAVVVSLCCCLTALAVDIAMFRIFGQPCCCCGLSFINCLQPHQSSDRFPTMASLPSYISPNANVRPFLCLLMP